MPFILTRINVGDYDRWKPMFDQDTPGARADAKGHRVFQNADDPGEVFTLVEFDSADDARSGRERLLASGVLDRFEDKTEPKGARGGGAGQLLDAGCRLAPRRRTRAAA